MTQVLVTGSNGQLGKCLQKIALNYENIRFYFEDSHTLDITSPQAITNNFSNQHYDYCINCAAYTNVEEAEKMPEAAFAVNAEGVKNLAVACEEKNIILIHISTDYVFEGSKKTPYISNDDTNPINIYGHSKLKGEEYIQTYLQRFFIIRTSWLYSEYGKNFYKTILEKAKDGEDLQITDEQTGCPTNANNLATYILSLINKSSLDYGIHHFTDGEAMTWHGFAEKILLENNLKGKVKLDKAKNYRTFAKRPKYSILG